MWRICESFHILPNDPHFQKLSPLQLSWIIENLALDIKERLRSLKDRGIEVETHRFETSDLDEILARRRNNASRGK